MKTNKLNTKDSIVDKKFAEEGKKIISYPRKNLEDFSINKRNLGVDCLLYTSQSQRD